MVLANIIVFYQWLWDTWRWRGGPEMLWEGLLRSGATVTTVLLRLMFSVSLAYVRHRTPNANLSRALEKEMILKSSESDFSYWLILWLDALPWTLVYPFVEWVLDCFRGAPSSHLVVPCKNTISFHLLLFFISKCLWKRFSLVCCHKQLHVNLLWTYGVW